MSFGVSDITSAASNWTQQLGRINSGAQGALNIANTLRGPAEKAQAALAKSTWVATAKDDLAVKDAYDIDGSSVITSVKNLMDASDLSFTDVLRGGKWVANQVPLLTQLVRQGAYTFTAKGLTARILGASNLAMTAMSGLSSKAAGNILGMVSQDKQLFAAVNGVVRRVAATNLSDISSVGRLINGITGNPTLFSVQDQDSQVGLWAGIIHEASALRIPNTWQQLTSSITNRNMLAQIANKTIPGVLRRADALTMRDMASTLGDKSLLSLAPNALQDFGAYYSLPELSTSKDISTEFANIKEAFTAVDSTWDMDTRETDDGPVETLNLTSLMSMSPDMRRVFTQGAREATAGSREQLYALANILPPISVKDSIAKSFPQTLFRPNQINTNNVVDPQIASENPELAGMSDDVAFDGFATA